MAAWIEPWYLVQRALALTAWSGLSLAVVAAIMVAVTVPEAR